MKLCVIGAGPASAYFIRELIARIPTVKIDIFERENRTLGHLRCGVAPDQIALKQQIKQLDKVLHQKGIRCLKNQSVTDISQIREMKKKYDAVVIATGAGNPKHLNIPGSHHAISAENLMAHLNSCNTQGVSGGGGGLDWVSDGSGGSSNSGDKKGNNNVTDVNSNKNDNGNEKDNGNNNEKGKQNDNGINSNPITPIPPTPTPTPTPTKHMAVIGNGNVALDVARMLLHHRNLKMHETVNRALLESIDVKKVTVIGRRSPTDAKFSNAVLAEVFKYPVSLINSDKLKTYLNKAIESNSLSRSLKRRFELLSSGKNNGHSQNPSLKPASVPSLEFAFWETPISITPNKSPNTLPGLVLTTQTNTGEIKKRNVDHIITAIGHEPSHLKKRLQEQQIPGVHILGWTKTDGQGTLSDAYQEARNLAATIVTRVNNEG